MRPVAIIPATSRPAVNAFDFLLHMNHSLLHWIVIAPVPSSLVLLVTSGPAWSVTLFSNFQHSPPLAPIVTISVPLHRAGARSCPHAAPASSSPRPASHLGTRISR